MSISVSVVKYSCLIQYCTACEVVEAEIFFICVTCTVLTITMFYLLISGTGSGSLSHAILRTVKPNGSLLTFDFHEDRAKVAREEFESHGYVAPLVTVLHRDVCKFGFQAERTENGADIVPDSSEAVSTSELVDGVFLDLPHPWLAIPHAKKMMKKGRQIHLLCI